MTMNSTDVCNAIEQIAKEGSTKTKVDLLTDFLKDETFLKAAVSAYNPFVVFGIGSKSVKELQLHATPGSEHFTQATWDLLGELANNELTGQAAIDAILAELNKLVTASQILLLRILQKDLRGGFSDGSINKARKGTIPVFPYMRCSLPKDAKLDEWPWAEGAFSQEKADGMFANMTIDAAGTYVSISSRQGSPFNNDLLGELPQAALSVLQFGTQTHGEMLVEQDGEILPRELSNGVLNHVLSGGALEPNQRVIFYAWDQIPLNEVQPKGKHEVPYARRFVNLQTQIPDNPSAPGIVRLIPTRIVHSLKDAFAHFSELLKEGKEGTIVKHPMAIWKDGTSKEQVKLKLEFVVELEVFDFVEGEGKNADTFGSLACRSACGQLEVNVSGFTDALRSEIHNNRPAWLNSIISVKANGVMFNDDADSEHENVASLFLPRFVEKRLDKTDADTLDQIVAQRDAAIEAA